MADLSARDSKLVQYLNEAYGKEKELETALEAHIGMTIRAPYKKRLRQHLTETKRHARELERRVKQLGGTPQTVPIEGLDPLAKGAGAAVGLAGRAVAAAKGPLHAIRGTGEQEKMLKNAKSEFADEHEEIATYIAIEALAEALGDAETAKLARAIRREEQSMASFLERQIPVLTKAVVQAEIPLAQRRSTRTRKRGTSAERASASRRQARRATASR
jgi:ferritin-like metal-binding protein YciE